MTTASSASERASGAKELLLEQITLIQKGEEAHCDDFLSEAFGKLLADEALDGSFKALAMKLPGPGTIYLGQTLRFTRPVKIGDRITAHLEVTGKRDDKKVITVACEVTNQDGKLVANGEAQVMASREKLLIDRPALPRFKAAD